MPEFTEEIMPENNKTQEFLHKLAPCIERGELEGCVEEAARVAQEMGIGAEELLSLSKAMSDDYAYVLGLAATRGLSGKDKAKAYFTAAYAAQYSGKLNEAEQYFKKAIEVAPELKYLHAYYAFLLALSGRKTEALEHYKIAIEVPPKYPMEHFNYAVLLEKLDMITEAEEHYKKAIEKKPEFAEAHNNYALLLTALNRKNEAEEHYKKALEINPDYVFAHINYAHFLREKGQLIAAEENVREALQIEPANPYALGTLGDILADEGLDFKEAKEAYHKALKNSASMKVSAIAEIHNNLGWVYAQLKHYSEAKEEFKIAIHSDTLNAKAHHNHRALNKVEEGIKPEISKIQKYLAAVLSVSLIVLFTSFLINKLSEAVFATQSTILIALLIFILLYHEISKFKAGAIEFEKSTEQRSQYVEAISKIER